VQPITNLNPNLHRGPSNSQEFNQIQNSIHYDLTQLFDVANLHDQTIRDNMDILIRENFFLQSKIQELETKLEEIIVDYTYKGNNLNKQQAIKSMYTLENITLGSASATIDTLYGIATIADIDRTSKIIYRSDDGTVTIPSSFSVSVLESNNTRPINNVGVRDYYTITDSNVIRSFDTSNNSIWAHTSSFPQESNISEVYGIIDIKLPLDMLNNLFANVLTIHPYPEYSMTIADILYKGYGNTWYRLPNFPKSIDSFGHESAVPIMNASKLMFSFPKIEITEIQIFFTQPYWFLNNGMRDFVYGFQEIGVEYRSYNSSIAQFTTAFDISDTNKRFYTIEKPITVANMGSDQSIDDLVNYQLYYDSALSNEFQFGNQILAPMQKVYVKTTLTNRGDVIPVVKNIKLNYIYKDMGDV
jgi:hypothetical protein